MTDFVCVWEFRSVDGRQVVRVVRAAEPGDLKQEHAYQRIVYRGPAAGYTEHLHGELKRACERQLARLRKLAQAADND